jgi:hypothetical protein
VIFFNEAAEGWACELNTPSSWVPGCIAVDEQGEQWVAVGGDDEEGADSWVNLDQITWASIKECKVRFVEHFKGFHFHGFTSEDLPIVATLYDDDGRTRVNTRSISLDMLTPDRVTVAGQNVEVWG